ncbi:MAG: hypothetical protein KIT31_06920 [Deltaproteobacteria bacterium]|nr:hypothetical protein [Deltaproteobacteria bacterium]
MRQVALVWLALAGCSIKHRSDDIVDAPPGSNPDDGPPVVTPPDGAPDIDAPPPFDVRDVPGLRLWLDGAQGVTKDAQNRVSKWADQSGNANDATAGDQTRPDFVAASFGQLPAIHFGITRMSGLSVRDAATLRWGADDFVVEVVTRFKNDPQANGDGVGCLFQKGGQGAGLSLFGNRDSSGAGAGGPGATGRAASVVTSRTVRATGALNNNKPHVIALRRHENTLELRVDGAIAAMTTGVDTLSVDNASAISIGSLFNGAAFRVDGDIAEVIAIVGDGSTTHLEKVESYLIEKYIP